MYHWTTKSREANYQLGCSLSQCVLALASTSPLWIKRAVMNEGIQKKKFNGNLCREYWRVTDEKNLEELSEDLKSNTQHQALIHHLLSMSNRFISPSCRSRNPFNTMNAAPGPSEAPYWRHVRKIEPASFGFCIITVGIVSFPEPLSHLDHSLVLCHLQWRR